MKTQSRIADAYERGLRRWLSFVVARPRLIIALIARSSVGAAWYAVTHMRMNSNTHELVLPALLAWRSKDGKGVRARCI